MYLNFKKFENISKDAYLFLGLGVNETIFSSKYRDKERIILTLEEPSSCNGSNGFHAKLSMELDKILTICPYTAELDSKRIPVFYPFNEDFLPRNFEKIYDIIYFGYYPWLREWSKIIKIANKYNFLDVGFNRSKFARCSYQTKIDLYSKSKITLIHNLAFTKRHNIHKYKSFPNSEKNTALKYLDDKYKWYNIRIFQNDKEYSHNITKFLKKWFLKLINFKWERLKWVNSMPQIKSRVFEAAFSKSLMLVYKDPWRVIEKFFTPNQEFLYFTNSKDLSKKLSIILNNYENYQQIIESAYNRAINNYTTKKFVEKYIGWL